MRLTPIALRGSTRHVTESAQAAASALIAEERQRDPLVVLLAKLVSIATQIEPELLRAMRLDIMPGAAASVEGDLWFGPLVQGRDPSGLSLLPEVAGLLREELAAPDQREVLDQARRVVTESHARHSPLIQLEERITYLAILRTPEALAAMEQDLGRAYAALQTSSDDVMARWVSRRLPRMQESTRLSEPALALTRAASLRLGYIPLEGVLAAGESQAPWLPEVLRELPRTLIKVRLCPSALELSHAAISDESTIEVPQTSPLTVEVSAPTEDGWTVQRVAITASVPTTLAMPVGPVLRVRNAIGDEIDVAPALGEPSRTAIVAGIDRPLVNEFSDLSWTTLAPDDVAEGPITAVVAFVSLAAWRAKALERQTPLVSDAHRQGIPIYAVDDAEVVRVASPQPGLSSNQAGRQSLVEALDALAATVGTRRHNSRTVRAQLRSILLDIDCERARRWLTQSLGSLGQTSAFTSAFGATVVEEGTLFGVWAPTASEVWVATDRISSKNFTMWEPKTSHRLTPGADGTWGGVVPGVKDGDPYLFWMKGGTGSEGFKRDPYARELGGKPGSSSGHCIVRDPHSYRWHDAGWMVPPHDQFILYELHVGVWSAEDSSGRDERPKRSGTFLDVVRRVEYLQGLGITAVLLLPIQAFPTEFSIGYNTSDRFAPEVSYQVHSVEALQGYLAEVNRLLAKFSLPPIDIQALGSGVNQLKILIDLLHLHGVAVILNLNFTFGGTTDDGQSIYTFDEQGGYLTDQGWAGGRLFAVWNDTVRRFLIDSALFFLVEYHVDGIACDDFTPAQDDAHQRFYRELSAAVRQVRPEALQIAENWGSDGFRAVLPTGDTASPDSAVGWGFDRLLDDRFRGSIRSVVGAVRTGFAAAADLGSLRAALLALGDAGQRVVYLENHDLVYAGRDVRVPRLADAAYPMSWYGRSRAQVITGLLLTAAGTPMLFMGQERLEDKQWSDSGRLHPDLAVGWGDAPESQVFLDCVRQLVALRRRLGSLRTGRIDVFHVVNNNRVLAFHRWRDDGAERVAVVISFSESAFPDYTLGFPSPGRWVEAFNSSDFHDRPTNRLSNQPFSALGGRLHGQPCSASIAIPANSILVFVSDSNANPPPMRTVRALIDRRATGREAVLFNLTTGQRVAHVDRAPESWSLTLEPGRYTIKVGTQGTTFDVADQEELDVPIPWPPVSRVVVVAGTGHYELSQIEVWLSTAIGQMLAEAGHRLIVGGWQGVDHIVAREFAARSHLFGERVEERLTQVVPTDRNPDFPEGNVVRVPPGDSEFDQELRGADALVVIGGIGGTYRVVTEAVRLGIRVLPLAASGGDARRTFEDLSSVLTSSISTLNEKVESLDDARALANAVQTTLQQSS
jgi:1,4-alpha-glucan branching enzyme